MKLYHAMQFDDYKRSLRLGKLVTSGIKPVLLSPKLPPGSPSPNSPREMLDYPYLYHRNKSGWVLITVEVAKGSVVKDDGYVGYISKRPVPVSKITSAVYTRGKTPDVILTKERADGALFHVFHDEHGYWGVISTHPVGDPVLHGTSGLKKHSLDAFKKVKGTKVEPAWPWNPPKSRKL